MNTKLLSSSILNADFSCLAGELKKAENAGSDLIHVDVMDGRFVPNMTIGPMIVKAISKLTSLPIDVHLMIENPSFYVKDFVLAGANFISVHQEACRHLHRVIQLIKNTGVKAGVAVNPGTSLDQIRWILKEVDFVLIMSVNPGFGGQKFIRQSLDKIAELRKIIKKMDLGVLIQIDGGINHENINEVSVAGGNIFVIGSAIFNSADCIKTVSDLKNKF